LRPNFGQWPHSGKDPYHFLSPVLFPSSCVYILFDMLSTIEINVQEAGGDSSAQLSSHYQNSQYGMTLAGFITVHSTSRPAKLNKTPIRANPLAFGLFAIHPLVLHSSPTVCFDSVAYTNIQAVICSMYRLGPMLRNLPFFASNPYT
jgi:hypothetical protein